MWQFIQIKMPTFNYILLIWNDAKPLTHFIKELMEKIQVIKA